MKAFIFVLLAGIGLMGGFADCRRAYAAEDGPVDMSKIEILPDYSSELSEADFLDNSTLLNEHPSNDKFLAYQIRLPTGWERSSGGVGMEDGGLAESGEGADSEKMHDLNQRLLGEIAKYYGPGRLEEPSRFEVRAQGLDFDVTAKNWFMREALESGYTLEGLKVISDRRIEALYVVVEGDTAFIVRVAAEINGPRIVLASYYVPEKFWMKERAFQQRAVESFKFLSPENRRVETVREYSFLDLMTFDYPASWKLAVPAIYSVDAMEARLVRTSDQKTLNGEIHISVVSVDFENALQDEIGYATEDISNRGLSLGDLIAKDNSYKIHDYLHYAHIDQYKVTDKANKIQEYEFWIGVLEEDRYYYVITLLTPSRTNEFFTWAQNQEVYKRLIESLRP